MSISPPPLQENHQPANTNVDDHFFACDLTDARAIADLQPAILQWQDTISVLVNNAKCSVRTNAISETAATWDATMAVGLRAPFLISQQLAPHMCNGSSIINIGSIAGRLVANESPSYHASKAGLEHLTRYLAIAYAPRGIRVNCVLPGFIVQQRHGARYWDDDNSSFREATLRCLSGARPGSDTDVAEVVEFLCSDASKFVSGTSIVVDGAASVLDQFNLSLRIAQE